MPLDSKVKEVTENLQQRVETVKNAIRSTVANHIRELEDQKSQLIGRLEAIYRSKEKVMINSNRCNNHNTGDNIITRLQQLKQRKLDKLTAQNTKLCQISYSRKFIEI